ncbi:hypothetical protein AS593_08565 [Caulobacter vibrioides]|nr:hypothetical protein AS593_08565 [Caulobacter vibrioides]
MVRVPYACRLGLGLALLALSTAAAAAEADKAKALENITVPQGSTIILNPGLTIIGQLQLGSGARIITRGASVQLQVQVLIIEGTAELIASTPAGLNTGSIELTVGAVAGGSLSILNAGTPGLPGPNAPPRDQSTCAADPAASAGNPGGPGQNGGDAGNVTIYTLSQSNLAAFRVLTDTNAAGQPQDCGGHICGGAGGPGGAGGSGVPVKPACDSNALGPNGPPGAAGSTGHNAQFKSQIGFNGSIAVPEPSRQDSRKAPRGE